MMCKKFLCLFLPLCLPPLVPAAEQWYLVSETQVRSIEQSLESWEADRLNWESQARGLNRDLEASGKLAKDLNDQLAVERERYRRLEQSFNEYEASGREERSRLAAEKQRAVVEKKSAENQRNMLFFILCAVVVVVFAVFFITKRNK